MYKNVNFTTDAVVSIDTVNNLTGGAEAAAGDQVVQNDYGGDGKVDIAVWRDSTGVWYIRNSRDLTTRTVQWGSSGDEPVPAFYRR